MALKIAALDEEDLQIVSAHVQDAIAKPIEILYERQHGVFTLPIRRFVWEGRRRFFRRHERRLAALSFKRVLSVRSMGVEQGDETAVLNLLAIRFSPSAADDPSGTIELVFSGDATVALEVECIEARLADLGAAWQTGRAPKHDA